MKYLKYLITAMMLLAVSQTAQGAVLDSCDQWASYCSGSYCCYNAVWGPTGNWSQCITAQSATQWTCVATHPGNGVKSYPNSGYLPSTTVGASISGSVSTSSGSSGDFCLAWDVWAPQEVMIWLKWVGAVGVWGSYVTTDTIGGRTYDVYKNGYPGFMVQSQMSGGTFDIGAVLNYCVNKGWLSSGATVTPVQCGFELTGCSNATFNMNSFSVSVGGATTSTTTTAATTSTTTTAATTSTTTTSATTSTTTTSGGGCDCGTCDWYGTNVPTCCESCSGWGWYDGGCRRSCVCPGSCPGGGTTSTTAATTSTTTTSATTSTTTTSATTSTTTTSATTTTTSATTTTSGGGDCDCGTCSWWGTPIPMCCIDVGGWGWQDGGCNRSCVSESICPNN